MDPKLTLGPSPNWGDDDDKDYTTDEDIGTKPKSKKVKVKPLKNKKKKKKKKVSISSPVGGAEADVKGQEEVPGEVKPSVVMKKTKKPKKKVSIITDQVAALSAVLPPDVKDQSEPSGPSSLMSYASPRRPSTVDLVKTLASAKAAAAFKKVKGKSKKTKIVGDEADKVQEEQEEPLKFPKIKKKGEVVDNKDKHKGAEVTAGEQPSPPLPKKKKKVPVPTGGVVKNKTVKKPKEETGKPLTPMTTPTPTTHLLSPRIMDSRSSISPQFSPVSLNLEQRSLGSDILKWHEGEVPDPFFEQDEEFDVARMNKMLKEEAYDKEMAEKLSKVMTRYQAEFKEDDDYDENKRLLKVPKFKYGKVVKLLNSQGIPIPKDGDMEKLDAGKREMWDPDGMVMEYYSPVLRSFVPLNMQGRYRGCWSEDPCIQGLNISKLKPKAEALEGYEDVNLGDKLTKEYKRFHKVAKDPQHLNYLIELERAQKETLPLPIVYDVCDFALDVANENVNILVREEAVPPSSRIYTTTEEHFVNLRRKIEVYATLGMEPLNHPIYLRDVPVMWKMTRDQLIEKMRRERRGEMERDLEEADEEGSETGESYEGGYFEVPLKQTKKPLGGGVAAAKREVEVTYEHVVEDDRIPSLNLIAPSSPSLITGDRERKSKGQGVKWADLPVPPPPSEDLEGGGEHEHDQGEEKKRKKFLGLF